MKNRSAFTLIELLIVVAIIGILAAIAVPNFLNAQMKARIANAEADMKTLTTSLEMYRLDNNMYPPWIEESGTARNPVNRRLNPLTSPISYLASVPQDPFVYGAANARVDDTQHEAYVTYDYIDAWSAVKWGGATRLGPAYRCSEWRINSFGPDYLNDTGALTYSASNGLTSKGDLVRTGPRASYSCDPTQIGL
jgi:type II secretion system protein G